MAIVKNDLYRFAVTGMASRASGAPATPYEVTSQAFELRPIPALEVIDKQVTDGTARVRARYPNPGLALVALPRRVRDGVAELTVRESGGAARQVDATLDAERLGFEAAVEPGSTIEAVNVRDGCGNG